MRRALLLASFLAACASRGDEQPKATRDGGTGEDGAVQPAGDGGGNADGGAEGGLSGGPLTVLSLNLHCLKTEGTAYATNADRFAAIATTVNAEDVDVILAQEVCTSAREDAQAMLVAALGKATGASWSSARAFAHPAWEGTPDEAQEHVAIFSRGALTAPAETVHRTQGSLRRVMLGATVVSRMLNPGSGAPLSIRVHTVHLDHATAVARAEQGREAASAAMVQTDGERIALDAGAGAVALPVLVGGDFNARSGEPAPQALLDFGFVETSGSAKTLRIDHLFAHRSAPFVPTLTKELFEGASAVSDHPGVLVRFAPTAPKGVRLTRVAATGTFAFPLSLRGDRGPLSWERGWPAFPRATSGEPSIVTSELPPGAFAYKFLRRDVDWATGNNAGGVGETDNASAPVFP